MKLHYSLTFALIKSLFYFCAMLAFGYVAVCNEKNILQVPAIALTVGSYLLFIHWTVQTWVYIEK